LAGDAQMLPVPFEVLVACPTDMAEAPFEAAEQGSPENQSSSAVGMPRRVATATTVTLIIAFNCL